MKVGDFGVSKKIESLDENKLTRGVGTGCYMAPELFEDNEYGTAVDIWALGVVLYELCMLKVPFKNEMELKEKLIPKVHPYSE